MKVPVLSAPLIMGSFRASGSSPCTCPSNCSSVTKQRHSSFLTSNQTGQKLLMGGAYISSPYGIAENRCHWHRCHAAHIWLRPGDSDLFLFPASIRIHKRSLFSFQDGKRKSAVGSGSTIKRLTLTKDALRLKWHMKTLVFECPWASAIVWMATFKPSHNWTASEQDSG